MLLRDDVNRNHHHQYPSKFTPKRHRIKANNDDYSFDFSSQLGWEEYYQKGLSRIDSNNNYNEDDDSNNETTTTTTSITTEWHTSMPLETIASYCWGRHKNNDGSDTWNRRNDRTNEDNTVATDTKSILMIGYGTSRLVDVIMDRIPANNIGNDKCTNSCVPTITLLDSSPTCLDELRRRYAHRFENVHFLCGDAIQLRSTLSSSSTVYHPSALPLLLPQRYDIIVDKGLMDVLFCSDDWTSDVTTLLSEASKVLVRGGIYILVSYKLPKATREFLMNIGDKVGYTWKFDCQGSTERVTLSIATCDPTITMKE